MHYKAFIYVILEDTSSKKTYFCRPLIQKRSRDQVTNNKIMEALKEILANKDIIQKVRDLNFEKEVQVKYKINELKARKDKELEHIILRNRYFGRLDRDGEEKIIDEIEKLIREKKNELKKLVCYR